LDTLILIGQIILVILGLFLVLVILLQPAKTAGLGSIAGGAETFFGKNKSKSFEGRMVFLTKIAAAAFLVISAVMVFLQK
jgi:preprotein translocase subunit SecG